MWEGGARVPCIMRWPEIISPGQSISNIASTIDIYPTIANILGDKIEGYANDGVSLLPLLNGEKNSNQEMNSTITMARNLLQYVKEVEAGFSACISLLKGVEPGKTFTQGPIIKGNPD